MFTGSVAIATVKRTESFVLIRRYLFPRRLINNSPQIQIGPRVVGNSLQRLNKRRFQLGCR